MTLASELGIKQPQVKVEEESSGDDTFPRDVVESPKMRNALMNL